MVTNESTLVPTKELVETKIISKFQTTRFYAASATSLEVAQTGVKKLIWFNFYVDGSAAVEFFTPFMFRLTL